MKFEKSSLKYFHHQALKMLIKIGIIQWIGKHYKLMTWHLTHYYAWIIKLYIHTFFIPFNTDCLMFTSFFVSSTSSSMQILPWIFDFMCCFCKFFFSFSLFFYINEVQFNIKCCMEGRYDEFLWV